MLTSTDFSAGLAGEVWVLVAATGLGTKRPGSGPAPYGGGGAPPNTGGIGAGWAAAAGGGITAAGLRAGAPTSNRDTLCRFLSSCNTRNK